MHNANAAGGGINRPPANPAERAKEFLTSCEVDLKKFRGIYSDDEIQDDIAWVERTEKKFEPSPIKKYGDIFEAVFCEQAEMNEWVPNSQVTKTSRFDDYRNKVDMVVETHDADDTITHLALGVDVTFGSEDLSKKFRGIRDNINKGELGSVKYFLADRPRNQKFAGPLRNIPHVVVGVEVDRVTELGLLWVNRKNRELATHPAQVTILEEISLQLETFVEYAKSVGGTTLVPILELELQKINEMLAQKKAAGLTGLKNDRVFEEIKRNLLFFYVTPDVPPATKK